MAFAILRVQKLKHSIAVRRSMQHALRAQETPNADPARTPENTASAECVSDVLDKFNQRLGTQKTIRSNAVLAIEYLITASPDAMREKGRFEQDRYFMDALEWLKAKHKAENIVAWGIHRDETTPHMYAVVVPIDPKGKLNCRHYLGGAKALNELQTAFARDVAQQHGLNRGIEGSKARHTSIQTYYARVNASVRPQQPTVAIPEPDLKARLDPAAYGRRVADSVTAQLLPGVDEMRAQAAERADAVARARDLERIVNIEKKRAVEAAREVDELKKSGRNVIEMIRRGGSTLEQFRDALITKMGTARRPEKDQDKDR